MSAKDEDLNFHVLVIIVVLVSAVQIEDNISKKTAVEVFQHDKIK